MLKKIVILFAFLYSSFAFANTELSEEQYFNKIRTKVLDVLQADNIKKDEKEKIISEVVTDHIAELQLARNALGQPWRKLNKSQKREYVKVFSIWAGKVIARRLLSLNIKEDLKIVRVYKGQNKIIVIRTVAVNPRNGQKVSIDWYIRKIKGKPKVLDVSVANVSLTLTQRAEFISVYTQKGIDGLISQMKSQY